MAQKNNSIEMLKKRLVAELKRDKKKATILGVLLLVGVFFVGKLLLKGSPQAATAAINPIATTGMPMPPEVANTATNSYPTVATIGKTSVQGGWGKKIDRDIFLPNATIFPHLIKTTDANGNVNVVKSEDSAQDIARKRKEELIRAEGAKLQLESAISGGVPIAIINGTVLGDGAWINGFRVVKIDSKACEVELVKDGITIKLSMKH
ncbi:MAG: hypothetical protein GY794_08995 [bacterium]|nr:hypothetical protein [bacterium]